MSETSNPKTGFNTPAVVFGGIAVVVFVYALSLFLQGGFLAAQALEYEKKQLTPPNEALLAAEAEQQALLEDGPRWLDEQQTKASIPIEAAMQRVIAKEQGPAPEGGR
ncbi:MAG: hypothetical protein ABIK96_01295 [bacterium]|nr:hypothetical protein [bacterium]